MKLLLMTVILASLVFVNQGQEVEDGEDTPKEETTWWSKFKQQVVTVLMKWRDDLKLLWGQVLSKAGDVKSYTAQMFEGFKLKLKEWLDSRQDVPDDEKNEIENFISKLKLATESPAKEGGP